MVVIDEASRVPDELYLAMRPMLHSGDGDLSQAAHAKAYVASPEEFSEHLCRCATRNPMG
jgi:hypothetical protein